MQQPAVCGLRVAVPAACVRSLPAPACCVHRCSVSCKRLVECITMLHIEIGLLLSEHVPKAMQFAARLSCTYAQHLLHSLTRCAHAYTQTIKLCT